VATPYQRGRRLEYRVIERLRRDGFFCLRSAGSHSPVDIVAVRDGQVIFIQVQRNRYIPKGKLEEFRQTCHKVKVKGYFVVTDEKGRLVWLDTDGTETSPPT